MEKLIITAAVTGSLVSREQNPDLPVTPREIARAAIDQRQGPERRRVHLHVRDPETGRPVQDPDLFAEVIGLIRQESDIIINVSTGGGPGMTYDQRIAVIPALSGDAAVRPEMASLNAGSVNFGVFSTRADKFVMDAVQVNPWPELHRFAKTMTAHEVKPEIEVYDAGMIHNALFPGIHRRSQTPASFPVCPGRFGGHAADSGEPGFFERFVAVAGHLVGLRRGAGYI